MTDYELTRKEIETVVRSVPGDFVAYWLVGRKMKVLCFTDTILSSFNVTAEEFRKATENDALDVVMPSDREYVLTSVTGKPAGPETIQCVFRLMHREKGFFWVHSKSRIIGTLEGYPVVLTNYLNLTDEAESFSRIQNDTDTAYYTVDARSYEVLYANRAARERAEVDRPEVYAFRPCYEYFFRRSEPCEDCSLKKLKPGEKSREEHFDPKTGRWRTAMRKRVSWCGHDCMEVFVDDITEKKAREEAEAANAMRYQLAVKGAHLAVWQYDIAEKKLYMPSGVNSQYARERYGIRENVLENVPECMMPMGLTDEDRENFRRLYREVCAGKEYATADVWFRAGGDGKPRCERLTYYGVKDETGRPTCAYGIGQDITTEKLEQENYHRSVQTILSANPDALSTFRVNLTQNRCSDGHSAFPWLLETLRSETADELFSRCAEQILHKEERERFCKKISRSVLLAGFAEGKNSVSAEYRRRDDTGRIYWVRAYINLLKNPETGDVEGVIYSTDISREKQQEEIFRILTYQEYDMIAILHLDTLRMEMVHYGRRLPKAGKEAEAALSLPCTYTELCDFVAGRWVDAADRDGFREEVRLEVLLRELQKNGSYEFTVREHLPDFPGETRLRKLQHFYLDEEKTKILLVEADATGLFRQQQREAELARAEAERVTDILDSVTAGVCVLHMADENRLSVAFVTLQIYRMLGYFPLDGLPQRPEEAPDELRKVFFDDAFGSIHPDDRERVRAAFRKNFCSERFAVEPYRMPCQNGEYRWVAEEVRLREITPEYRVFYATFRDVTEEKALQDQLAEKLKQEKSLRMEAMAASAAKSDFLSRMSHDIRTPLNGIVGMTYLAGEQNNPPETTDCLAKIGTSSRFLMGLINDILDMSKAESGKIELHPEPYLMSDFNGYIDSVIRPLYEGKNQTFTVELHPVETVIPVMDVLRYNQIIFNLLSNAVKYTPEGGKIRLTMYNELIAGHRERITAVVSDSGIGMSEEFMKVLFNPFTQGARSDTSENRGSGLGLAIAKKMVDLMGGTIAVESKLGRGTTFTVTVDFDYLEAEQAAWHNARENGTAADYSVLAGKHVLLCEDHPLNQEIAKALLAERKMLVTLAEDGREGLRQFEGSAAGYYDAVLMDIRMPVMDGYEAARRIRALSRTDAKTVPIIAMTADAFEDDVQKCREAGMNRHISKPVEPERLYAVLYEVFRKRPQKGDFRS